MPADFKPFDKAEWLRLEKKADELRRLTVQTTVWGGSGHIGGAMSAMDAMTILYHRFMKLDVNNPDMEDRDRFVLSKGHAAVGYGPVICDYGFMPVEGLHNFNLTGSKFGMHLDKNNEGSNWEAAMTAAQFKLSNVVVLVDNNKCMIDGRVDDEMKVEPLDKKFEAFGFKVKRVDGQNMKELNDAIEDAIANHKNGGDQPYCIVMDTFKGAGIDFMEDDYHWHYGALDEAKEKACYESLDKYYKKRCERAEKEG